MFDTSPADVNDAWLYIVFQRTLTALVTALKITCYDFKHFLLLPRSQKFRQACSYQHQEKLSLSRLSGFTEMMT